jgi:tetratricopeptide (TPR) repeat protein
MRQKRLFALVVASSLSIASIGLTQASPSPSASPSPTPIQSPDLKEADVKKLIQEEIKNGGDIRDRVQSDVNRTFGISMTLLQVLLGVLAALPIFTAVVLWCLRESIKNQLVTEAKQQVKEQLKSDVAIKIHQETQKLQSKIEDLSQGLDELYAENYINLGEKKFLESSYDDAVSYYDRAIKLNPNIPFHIWTNHGVALGKLNRNEEALISYRKVVDLQPHMFISWFNQANALSRLDRNEEAILSYNKAVEIQPNSHEALAYLGSVLSKLGRYEKALECYEAAIKLNASEYKFVVQRGVTLFKLGRYKEAMEDYNRVIDIQPSYADVFYDRACCNGAQRNLEEAILDLRKAIELNPEFLELAKADSDFDLIRQSDAFQKLLNA